MLQTGSLADLLYNGTAQADGTGGHLQKHMHSPTPLAGHRPFPAAQGQHLSSLLLSIHITPEMGNGEH